MTPSSSPGRPRRLRQGRTVRLVALLASLATTPSVPGELHAGTNQDGRLVLHVTRDLGTTRDSEDRNLRNCESAVTSLPGDESVVAIYLLASFPSWGQPRVAGLTFGVDHQSYVQAWGLGPDYTFYLPSSGWPGPFTGIAVTTGNQRPVEDRLSTVCWFTTYAYDGTTFQVVEHPEHGYAAFGDDTVPSVLDRIRSEDLGKIGFGVAGHNPCLIGVATGACCSDDGSCLINTEIACQDAEGTYLGDDTTCSPFACVGACCLESGDCSQELPRDCERLGGWFRGVNRSCTNTACLSENVTWGELKRSYRNEY